MIDPYGVSYRPYGIDPYSETIGVCIGVYGKPDRPYIDPYPKPARAPQKEVFLHPHLRVKLADILMTARSRWLNQHLWLTQAVH